MILLPSFEKTDYTTQAEVLPLPPRLSPILSADTLPSDLQRSSSPSTLNCQHDQRAFIQSAAGATGLRRDSDKDMAVSPHPGQEDWLLGGLASSFLPSTCPLIPHPVVPHSWRHWSWILQISPGSLPHYLLTGLWGQMLTPAPAGKESWPGAAGRELERPWLEGVVPKSLLLSHDANFMPGAGRADTEGREGKGDIQAESTE